MMWQQRFRCRRSTRSHSHQRIPCFRFQLFWIKLIKGQWVTEIRLSQRWRMRDHWRQLSRRNIREPFRFLWVSNRMSQWVTEAITGVRLRQSFSCPLEKKDQCIGDQYWPFSHTDVRSRGMYRNVFSVFESVKWPLFSFFHMTSSKNRIRLHNSSL